VFAALGITCTFVQDDPSMSVAPFTLRGLHFQTPPRAQDDLVGLAHRFLTLDADCGVTYECLDSYATRNDAGVRWNDPEIGIDWRIASGVEPELSDKVQPLIRQFDSPFVCDGHQLTPLQS
jgi:dTDP-4-dehydrorhamnose 3,5-epimerase